MFSQQSCIPILSFTVPPQISPFDFGEESVNSGESASITCLVHKGDLPVEIWWLHNNMSITDGEKIVIMRSRMVNTLTIESVSSEDSGEYTCVARNQTSHTAVLNVNGIFSCYFDEVFRSCGLGFRLELHWYRLTFREENHQDFNYAPKRMIETFLRSGAITLVINHHHRGSNPESKIWYSTFLHVISKDPPCPLSLAIKHSSRPFLIFPSITSDFALRFW